MASKRSKPAECSLLLFAITSSDVRVSKIIITQAISQQQFNVFTSNWVQRFLRGLGIFACTLLLRQKSARNFLQIVEVLILLTVQYSTKVQSCNQFCIVD